MSQVNIADELVNGLQQMTGEKDKTPVNKDNFIFRLVTYIARFGIEAFTNAIRLIPSLSKYIIKFLFGAAVDVLTLNIKSLIGRIGA